MTSGGEKRHTEELKSLEAQSQKTSASLTPLMTLPMPTLKLSGLVCFFFLAAAERQQRGFKLQEFHLYLGQVLL